MTRLFARVVTHVSLLWHVSLRWCHEDDVFIVQCVRIILPVCFFLLLLCGLSPKLAQFRFRSAWEVWYLGQGDLIRHAHGIWRAPLNEFYPPHENKKPWYTGLIRIFMVNKLWLQRAIWMIILTDNSPPFRMCIFWGWY